MFDRPIVAIAIFYACLIIILRPFIPEPPKQYEKSEMPIISGINTHFVSIISQTTPKPYDSLLASIVFGTGVSPLDPDLKDRYKKVGLAHLLVASGTQVSILIGVCLAIIRSLKMPTGIGVLIASIVNILFALMTGCGPSIIRSAVMGQITLLGLLFDREGEIYTSLGIAALILMIIDPLIIFNIGFQLTFAATWALVYLCKIFEEKGIPSIVAVALSPVIVTMPITLYNFNQLSIVALPINILVVPIVETLTILGFISTFLGLFFLPIAEILNFPIYLILKILNGIVYLFSDFRLSCVYFKQPGILIVILYYAILVYIAEKWRNKEALKFNKQKIVLGLLLLVCVFTWNAAIAPNNGFADSKLQVSVIDVKQGDSIFVKSPSGMTMLVDAGPKFRRGDAGKSFVLPFLRKQGINKLDVVVLTHPHDDHVGGMVSVLREMPVGLVIDSGQAHTSKSYIDFLKLIDENKIVYKLGRAGQIIDLGAGISAKILHPTDDFIEGSALNNNSIVIKLTYKKFSMLLMGDAEKEGEAAILGRYPAENLQADFLKVGHHGSKTSSSLEFLGIVKPKVAVISVGAKNKFFHPHPSTVKNLQEIGVQVHRTDLNKTVTISTDGLAFKVLPYQ